MQYWTQRWQNGPSMGSHELVDVPAYAVAPDGQQPDGVTALENIDCRLLSATMRDGRLFTVHTIAYDWGSGHRAAIRPYRLNVSGSTTVRRRRRSMDKPLETIFIPQFII